MFTHRMSEIDDVIYYLFSKFMLDYIYKLYFLPNTNKNFKYNLTKLQRINKLHKHFHIA